MVRTANSDARFSATHWSVVLTAAAHEGEPGAQAALDELCRKYWYPIYAFLRRKGNSPPDAEDLTQGFFADLLLRDWLASVGAEKGKFRTFLLACLDHYVHKVHARQKGPTRDPGRPILSLDAQNAEPRYALEPVEVRDPALLFERRLAFTLIADVLHQLHHDYTAQGKGALSEALRAHLVGDAERGGYAETAARLNMSEGALRVAVSRMRDRFRELLRGEVARTVVDPRSVDEEIRYLMQLSRG